MIFKNQDKQKIKVHHHDIQVIPASFTQEAFYSRLEIMEKGFDLPKSINDPCIVHFCEQKPFLYNKNCHSYPFTLFRIQHYINKYGFKSHAWAKVLAEEIVSLLNKIIRKITKSPLAYQQKS